MIVTMYTLELLDICFLCSFLLFYVGIASKFHCVCVVGSRSRLKKAGSFIFFVVDNGKLPMFVVHESFSFLEV